MASNTKKTNEKRDARAAKLKQNRAKKTRKLVKKLEAAGKVLVR